MIKLDKRCIVERDFTLKFIQSMAIPRNNLWVVKIHLNSEEMDI